ncbi:MAG TPA: bifunctional diguanylate cyclase/phosphodiesterase [Solirubrobacteraceae bacterium]|nr:bifunctional diguanylate cyclase/phosphodiesterase [Solirubrobacteraceae bacterium]
MSAPPRQRLAGGYVLAVTVTGVGVLAVLTVMHGSRALHNLSLPIILLVAAVIAGELLPIKVGPDAGEVTPSTSFTFALLLSHGVTLAILAHSLGSLVADARSRKPLHRTAFNIAQYVLAIAAAAVVLRALTSIGHPAHFRAVDVPAFLLAATLFFALNSFLVATAISLHTGVPLRRQLSSDLMFHSGTEAILLGMAPLAVLALDYAPVLLPLVGLPLLAAHRAGRHAVLAEQIAMTDALTGLPNRVRFRDRVEHAIATTHHHGELVAVMLIDVDRFKEVNDTLGHHVGDEVLRQVAGRLRDTLREGDTVARLGGDEFAVLLDPIGSPEAADAVAAKLREAVAQPVEVAGIRFPLAASIGIALHPGHGDDVDVLMRRADVAMYQAKLSTSGFDRYSAERDDNSVVRLTMAGALSRALDDGELEVHYQPKIDARSGAVAGLEALARWFDEGRDAVPPDEFIAVAEHTGLIIPLTFEVVRQSLAQLAAWRAGGHAVTVAVNLSPRTLAQADLPDRIDELCRDAGVPPAALVLEITESMAAADPQITVPVVHRLAQLGVSISVDDFGTGFSSLDSLRGLPVRELKIDRRFVRRMSEDPQDAAIVRFAIDLGHSLGMRVVAEGVETQAVRTELTRLGCDLLQGFHFSPAVPGDQVVLGRASTPGGAVGAARAA